MYQIENLKYVLAPWRGRDMPRLSWPVVSRTVLCLGLTSMFTDVSSEMVSTVLPLYLVFYLQLTPLEFGVVDGLYQGVAALVRVGSGMVADRWRRHKEVAAVGYGLSAICKLGLLAAGGTWTALAAVVLLDRTGKGVRTAPRDALISLSTTPDGLATAFGVHRSLDTVGAILGPIVAFGLLALIPNGFDAVFVASFCAALVGLGILMLFVENRAGIPSDTAPAASARAVVGLLRAPRFRALALAGTVLALATVSDAFLYLGLQRRLALNVGLFPLLYVATALVYFVLAVPTGQLADRVGRGRVFIGGYVVLLIVYSSLLLPELSYLGLFAYLVLFGAYYAATDGVLMALASAVLPPALRTSGLALLSTATSVASLLASVLFGALWTWWGVEATVSLFAVGLLAALVLATVVLVRTEARTLHEQATTP